MRFELKDRNHCVDKIFEYKSIVEMDKKCENEFGYKVEYKYENCEKHTCLL